MKNLILTSWGSYEIRTDEPEKIFVNLIGNKKMLFIPLANSGVPYTNMQYYEYWIGPYFAKFGFTSKIDMWEDVSDKSEKDLEAYGGIYIMGGNSFDLISRLRVNNFMNLLSKYVDNGGAVFGVSAGTIIFTKDAGTAYLGGDADTNRIGLTDLRCLDKFFGLSILCHYRDNIDDEPTYEYVRKTGNNVVALKDEGAIYVTDDSIKVLGNSDVYLFTKKEKILIKANTEITKEEIDKISNDIKNNKK